MTDEIFQYRRPVIMLGNSRNLEFAPGSLQYIKDGHYWVCDGVREEKTGVLNVFTEWQPYGNGSFTSGWGSADNPESLGGIFYNFHHMNWGWGKNSGMKVWYNLYGEDVDFKYSKKNFYLSL